MSYMIYKWTFAPGSARQAFVMPVGSAVLHVAEDPGQPFPTVAVWTQHTHRNPYGPGDHEQIELELVGTGHEAEHPPERHVGTAVLSNGLVLHVFRVEATGRTD